MLSMRCLTWDAWLWGLLCLCLRLSSQVCAVADLSCLCGRCTLDRALWEGGDASVSSSVVVAVMSESERTEYEEKRLKMMRAMGESIAQGEEGESSDAADRR